MASPHVQNEFTDEELLEQLSLLGYSNVPEDSLYKFRRELQSLSQNSRSDRGSVRSSNLSTSSFVNLTPCTASTFSDQSSPSNLNSPSTFSTPEIFIRKSGQRVNKEKLYTDREQLVNDKTTKIHVDDSCSPAASSFISPNGSNSKLRQMKRKVLRHINGESIICDESPSGVRSTLEMSTSTTSTPTWLYDMRQTSKHRNNGESNADFDNSKNISHVPSQKLSKSRSCDDVSFARYPSKSFIRPAMGSMNLSRTKKCDPVRRYHQYKQLWETYKIPGEKNHNELRWMVREQMLSDPNILLKNQRRTPAWRSNENLRDKKLYSCWM